MRPIILFACPQMDLMARRIVANHESNIVSGEIEWNKFKDGWPNFRIVMDDEDVFRGRDVAFLAAFETPSDCVVQRWVMNAFGYYQARTLTVLLPYYPPGTMDRKEQEGEIVTAKSLARDLSLMPSGLSLKNRIIMWDIHNKSEWHYFEGSNAVPILTRAIPLLKQKMDKLSDRADVSVVFPDDGAVKRFGKQFHGWPKIFCDKLREGDKRKITIKEGNPRGRHCIIVDDLAQTFGTQLECGRALFAAGAAKISMYVTHAVAPQGSWRRICNADFPIENFWITDSCPWTTRELMTLGHEARPFEVLSLVDLIAQQILGVLSYFEN